MSFGMDLNLSDRGKADRYGAPYTICDFRFSDSVLSSTDTPGVNRYWIPALVGPGSTIRPLQSQNSGLLSGNCTGAFCTPGNSRPQRRGSGHQSPELRSCFLSAGTDER